MRRIQTDFIRHDLDRKMVFITGPRQVGKTTLAREVAAAWNSCEYLNFDADVDRPAILRQEWDRERDLVILDEVHKLKRWKTRLKGVYDTEGIPPRILVTGSARLDVYRRGGDSLAGRYFLHRLYPLSVRELRGTAGPGEILDRLNRRGGFPEPYLAASDTDADRWRLTHTERIIRGDVQDLEPVRDVPTMLLLVDLLRERVGLGVSYASLARDLEISPHTVKRWIGTLENMYVLFRVTPFHGNRARSLLKEPKMYFYDTGVVRGGPGAKLENTVAVCLRKWLHFREDTRGEETGLHYVRDKEKREVDFLVTIGGKHVHLLEVKSSEDSLHPALKYYSGRMKVAHAAQLVGSLRRSRKLGEIRVLDAAAFLDGLDA